MQIADVFLQTDFYVTALENACNKCNSRNLKVVIMNIHTELDPCNKCRTLWSKISKEINEQGYYQFITRNYHPYNIEEKSRLFHIKPDL